MENNAASPSRRRERAKIWDHFVREHPPSTYAKCIHCHMRFAADPLRHGSSRLYAHLKNCRMMRN
ncbi:hypothetical protein MKW94_001765 [Papaver nudicaule]|uniref:BED-type domain-containing protein n=1 Tax=Papaver nudicaule TaxID=74823 RepID=A0AA41VMT3_PAPNU|nr:hypothetical protein [Papaver nudicaule]